MHRAYKLLRGLLTQKHVPHTQRLEHAKKTMFAAWCPLGKMRWRKLPKKTRQMCALGRGETDRCELVATVPTQ